MEGTVASVAIVGRPNVGKSSLFNRLTGRSQALVDNRPGVTRDIREGRIKTRFGNVILLDTGGLEKSENALGKSIMDLTWRGIAEADAHVLVIDGRQGVLAADFEIARQVRGLGKPVILVANKMERGRIEVGYSESFMLGFGEPFCTSAEHRIGIDELRQCIVSTARVVADSKLAAAPDEEVDQRPEQSGEAVLEDPVRPVRIAIVGRPNAGKSTLVNRILGRQRLLTGEMPGLTRDAISVSADWLGRPVELFDTAGMRRKSKVTQRVERLAVNDGLRAVRFAEVVIVLLDARFPFEMQDLRLAALAAEEGRATIVVLNKWDLIPDKGRRYPDLAADFSKALPQIQGSRLVAASAKSGEGLKELHRQVFKAYSVWNRRVPTGPLNRWLADMVRAHPPPAFRSKRIRLRYITQVNTRPPSFVLKCSRPGKLPRSYTRYLKNGLRNSFDLPGTPIRISLRSQSEENPYD